MTEANGSDRISRLESLVLDFARSVNAWQNTTEIQLNDFIEQSNENFRALSNAHRVTEQQIAALSEAQRLTNESVQSIGSLVLSLGESVRNLVEEAIPQMNQRIEENNQAIREMQAEVKGLQTENCRMLDHLFGQQNGGSE